MHRPSQAPIQGSTYVNRPTREHRTRFAQARLSVNIFAPRTLLVEPAQLLLAQQKYTAKHQLRHSRWVSHRVSQGLAYHCHTRQPKMLIMPTASATFSIGVFANMAANQITNPPHAHAHGLTKVLPHEPPKTCQRSMPRWLRRRSRSATRSQVLFVKTRADMHACRQAGRQAGGRADQTTSRATQ